MGQWSSNLHQQQAVLAERQQAEIRYKFSEKNVLIFGQKLEYSLTSIVKFLVAVAD